jgi:hypothetical protein
MKSKLLSRVERLEAHTKRARQSVIQLGVLKPLPGGYVGERHVVAVAHGAPGTPDWGPYGFEERPGPEPPGAHDDATRVYVSEDDLLL